MRICDLISSYHAHREPRYCSRLKEYKDTSRLAIFTLDLAKQRYPVTTMVDALPYDSFTLIPTSTEFGGVMVLTGNSVIFVDQAARRVVLPVNGWPSRVSDLPLLDVTAEERERYLELEGSRGVFIDDKSLLLVLKDGTIHCAELSAERGKVVSKITLGGPIGITAVPACIKRTISGCIFIGSIVGPSVLMKTSKIEEEVADDIPATTAPVAVVDTDDFEMDDDDEGRSLPLAAVRRKVKLFEFRHLRRFDF